MIAAQRNEPAGAAQGDHLLEDAARVRPAIDVVAEGDNQVVRMGSDGVEQGAQGDRATVDVADGEDAHVTLPQAETPQSARRGERWRQSALDSPAACARRSTQRGEPAKTASPPGHALPRSPPGARPGLALIRTRRD